VSNANVKRAQRAAAAKTEGVRFWIITMLLVLFGLSTLKLR
jgi:UDP-N-acetylmuramyl pentapeptide phosphotransferase/UDP-N-acetylglucosamine-1-phosphate transferase